MPTMEILSSNNNLLSLRGDVCEGYAVIKQSSQESMRPSNAFFDIMQKEMPLNKAKTASKNGATEGATTIELQEIEQNSYIKKDERKIDKSKVEKNNVFPESIDSVGTLKRIQKSKQEVETGEDQDCENMQIKKHIQKNKVSGPSESATDVSEEVKVNIQIICQNHVRENRSSHHYSTLPCECTDSLMSKKITNHDHFVKTNKTKLQLEQLEIHDNPEKTTKKGIGAASASSKNNSGVLNIEQLVQNKNAKDIKMESLNEKIMPAINKNIGNKEDSFSAGRTNMEELVKTEQPCLNNKVYYVEKGTIENMTKAKGSRGLKDKEGKNASAVTLKNKESCQEKGSIDIIKDQAKVPLEIHRQKSIVQDGSDHTDLTMRGQQTSLAQAHLSSSSENQSNAGINYQKVINQIVNSTEKIFSKGVGRVTIKLNPHHLGSLNLDVHIKNNKIHVNLKTESGEVRQVLQTNIEQLKRGLNDQGLIVDNISISVHDKTDGSGSDSGHNQTLFQQGKSHKNNEEKQMGEESFIDQKHSISEKEITDGYGMGYISLFA